MKMDELSKTKDIAEAVKGIVEAVPIYQDAIQPAAKEIGTALQTITKTIHIALAPISVLVWGYEQIRDFISCKLVKKLENVPKENIITPKVNIAGPTLEALRFCGNEDDIKEMYANLLASSMNIKTANGAHPAFIEIIKQLTPDEAKLMKYFSQDIVFPMINISWKQVEEKSIGSTTILNHYSLFGYEANCEYPSLTPQYLDNLERLGLIEMPQDLYYTAQGIYDKIENHTDVVRIKEGIERDKSKKIEIERAILRLTYFGKKFCNICIFEKM
jgi:hypothetical protein